MLVPELKQTERDREYKNCPQHIRDSIVYNYLFEGKSHRWLDDNIVREDSKYSRGYISMGVLHHLGLVNDHKGIFKGFKILNAVSILEELNNPSFNMIIMCLVRHHYKDYQSDSIDCFIPSKDSPQIVKKVGKSQYTDGVRIEKKYHDILNPVGTKYYTQRGSARKIRILFNNKIFNAEYRYEGQTDESKELQSIRFRKDLKDEFKKVFPEPVGNFTIQYGSDLFHFIFSHQALNIQYPEDEVNEYSEGRVAYRKHKIRERNQMLIKKAKKRFMRMNGGRLYCEVCGFDFSQFYGERGKNFIEGHHTKLVSELKEGETTKVEDIAMLCSNCHRMIHRKPILTVANLTELIRGK